MHAWAFIGETDVCAYFSIHVLPYAVAPAVVNEVSAVVPLIAITVTNSKGAGGVCLLEGNWHSATIRKRYCNLLIRLLHYQIFVRHLLKVNQRSVGLLVSQSVITPRSIAAPIAAAAWAQSVASSFLNPKRQRPPEGLARQRTVRRAYRRLRAKVLILSTAGCK